MVIGISGGSASGKTTFTRELVAKLSTFQPVHLNQDQFFRSWQDVAELEREAMRTSNHPRAVLWPELVAHVGALKRGDAVVVPVAGSAAHARGVAPRVLEPGKIVLVEGHLIFGRAPLRDLMDLKIFVDVDPHERVLRRMVRDTSRGRMDLDGAVAWYRRDVIPNYPIYTEPTRQYADIIVPYEGETDAAAEALANGVCQMLQRADQSA